MPRILIAEEDSQLRRLFSRVLQKNGYTVTEVGSGPEGVEAAQERYDLVVSDVTEAGMNGFDLIRELRSAGNRVPVLLLTAKDLFDEMRQGFLSGRYDYMIKPINTSDLVRRIGEILNRARSMTAHTLALGGTVLCTADRSVTSGGKTEVLPEEEFWMLYQMAANPGRIFTCQQLLELLGERDLKRIEEYLDRLRERFCSSQDLRIVTMRGIGSKLTPIGTSDTAAATL